MLYALYKLSSQNKVFFVSTIISIVLILISLAIVLMYVFGIRSVAYDVLNYVQNLVSNLLLAFVLASVFVITKEVGLKKYRDGQ